MSDRFIAFAIEAVLYLVYLAVWILLCWLVFDQPLVESEHFTDYAVINGQTTRVGDSVTYSIGDNSLTTLGWLVYCVAFVALEVRQGQTFGKRVIGLQVVDQNTGNRPSVSQSILRLVFFFVGMIGLFIPSAIIMARSPLNQRMGDSVAKTLVIYRRR